MFAAVSAHFECCGQTLRLYSSPQAPSTIPTRELGYINHAWLSASPPTTYSMDRRTFAIRVGSHYATAVASLTVACASGGGGGGVCVAGAPPSEDAEDDGVAASLARTAVAQLKQVTSF